MELLKIKIKDRQGAQLNQNILLYLFNRYNLDIVAKTFMCDIQK